MALNEENGREEYRADSSAGTDEEYFELLDRRRRELARGRAEKTEKPPTAHPQDNSDARVGTARSTASGAAQKNGGTATAHREVRQPQQPNVDPARQPNANAARRDERQPQRPKTTAERKSVRQPQQQQQQQQQKTNAARRRNPAPAKDARRTAKPISAEEVRRREEARRIAAARRAEAEKRRAEEERRRAEEEKRRKEIKKRIRAKKRAELAGRALAAGENLLIFFGIFIIVCAVAFSAFVIYLSRTVRPDDDDTRGFTYRVEESSRSLGFEDVVSDGVIYVDFTGIAGLCGMSISGVREELTFEASGERAVFVPGSDRAYVNGTQITLEGAALLREEHLWLPLSFVQKYVSGVETTLDEVEKRGQMYRVISVSRTPDPEATGALDCWLEPSFRLKAGETLAGLSPYDTPEGSLPVISPAPVCEFISDLSAYERYMSPDGTMRDSFLMLVNSDSRLSYRYVPSGLTKVADARTQGAEIYLSLYAEKALEALLLEARAAGFDTITVSGAYVSYDTQAAAFDSYLSAERNYSKNNYAATGKRFSDEAYAVLGSDHITDNYISKDNYTLSLADARRVVLSYCAEPGSDEHQSGLCLDLCDTSPAAADFADSEFYGWLSLNAHKFGFILRYPADKTEQTGHAFEPWHLRFVGRYHAFAISSSGLCFEEYLEAMRDTNQ